MREGTRKKPERPGVFHGFRHIYFLGKENAIFKLRYVLSCTCNVSESPWHSLSLLSSVVHATDTMCQTVAYKTLKPKNGNRPFQLVCLSLFYHFRPRDGTAKNFSFKFCPVHVHPCAHVCTGSEIAPSWSPMRLKIQFWRPEFHSWSPASDL